MILCIGIMTASFYCLGSGPEDNDESNILEKGRLSSEGKVLRITLGMLSGPGAE